MRETNPSVRSVWRNRSRPWDLSSLFLSSRRELADHRDHLEFDPETRIESISQQVILSRSTYRQDQNTGKLIVGKRQSTFSLLYGYYRKWRSESWKENERDVLPQRSIHERRTSKLYYVLLPPKRLRVSSRASLDQRYHRRPKYQRSRDRDSELFEINWLDQRRRRDRCCPLVFFRWHAEHRSDQPGQQQQCLDQSRF